MSTEYVVGKEVVPLFAACGEMHEVLRPSGERFFVVAGSRDRAEEACRELNRAGPRDRLPAILTYGPRDGQAISVLRALKSARDALDALAVPETEQDDERLCVAIGDLEIMIGAVR